MWRNLQFLADLVTFTEEIINRKFHFLCSTFSGIKSLKKIRLFKGHSSLILAQPAYTSKVNNRNTGTRCEICLLLTIKTSEGRQWRRCGVFIVNFDHISHLVLVFLLLTLSRWMSAGLILGSLEVLTTELNSFRDRRNPRYNKFWI